MNFIPRTLLVFFTGLASNKSKSYAATTDRKSLLQSSSLQETVPDDDSNDASLSQRRKLDDMMPPDGYSIRCLQEPDKIYRWTESELRYYTSGQIASSWNTAWREDLVQIDCLNIPIGMPMSMNFDSLTMSRAADGFSVADGYSVRCLEEPDKVYRWQEGELHHYPSGIIASSWDEDWREALVETDCLNVPIGEPMSSRFGGSDLGRASTDAQASSGTSSADMRNGEQQEDISRGNEEHIEEEQGGVSIEEGRNPTETSSTSLLLNALEEFQKDTKACSEGGLGLASIIEDDIIPNLKVVDPLQLKIDEIKDKFKIVYEERKIIKTFAKLIPKVGKMIIFVVEKIETLYLGLDNLNESLEAFTPEKTKRLIENLETLLDILVKEIEDRGVGLAYQAGYMANFADLSKGNIEKALECSSQVDVDKFSSDILEEVVLLKDAAKICTALPTILKDLKLQFLGSLYTILEAVQETIEPVLDLINEILDTIGSTATEVACCTISPHLQAAGQAIAAVVDYTTCFAGSLEGLLDDLLRELVPDASISESVSISGMPLYDFQFNGINLDINVCGLELQEIATFSRGTLDLELSIDFDLHEALSIADDEDTLLDDIKQSCNPDTLADDISSAWGGDCCCTARKTVSAPGTFCLKFEAFFFPGSYEIAAAATGLERCTCCEDNVWGDEGCKGETAYCGSEVPPQKSIGEECPSSVDCECGSHLDCGKRNYWDDTYVCCKNSFVPLGWTTDLCGDREKGETCGTTEDPECVGHLQCGKKDYWNEDKYICCEETFVPVGWTTDLCVAQNPGDSCGTTEDAECAGGMACARTTRDGDYKCCWGTYDCYPWTPNCDTGAQYCKTGEGFSYEVFIRTGDVADAGTDSNIEIIIVGTKGQTSAHVLNPLIDGNAFERGNEDTAIVWDENDVGEVTSINLYKDNAWAAPGWYLESIGIGRTKFATFDSWIDPYQWYSKALGNPPRDYKVEVHTGTDGGAGTDANIDLTLYGTEGAISVRLNPMISGDAFENGDYDIVYLKRYQDIGTLTKLRICNDGSYAGSGWKLDWVKIDNRQVNFHSWFDGSCGERSM